jgi:hypothetical protein
MHHPKSRFFVLPYLANKVHQRMIEQRFIHINKLVSIRVVDLGRHFERNFRLCGDRNSPIEKLYVLNGIYYSFAPLAQRLVPRAAPSRADRTFSK